MKIEIFDDQGKLVDTCARQQPARPEPCDLVDAAQASARSAGGDVAFGPAIGPRVLPDTYTVKLTKDKQIYTMQLAVVADPRAKYTAEDRGHN